ncbi:iron-containing alcohol dehydrogenase [Paenibacillus piri]|uniref:Iron-containing alcohol dehydrogenase n=1 Tax=Paenibacillus piri TaxID=2547395 RepID=A0A4R5K909_9BACL|nr:iron-containing alcohol dehydrogenase [Paenibacillus piri]
MRTFITPVKIVTGPGSLKCLTNEIVNFNISKVMIFADPGVIKAGMLDSLAAILKDLHVDYMVYSDIQPEPPLSVGDRAVQAIRESQAELIIGIGGGSCLDIAKAAAVLCMNEGSVADYLNLTGTKKLIHKGIPKILIPTTSGTGAEVTDIAVFSLDKTKDVLTHPYLLADIALVDPELTFSLPPKISAATGIDALTHAVEAVISVNASPLTDTLALEAIRRISSSLRTAVWHGTNRTARAEMSYGSLLAGMSFYNAGVSGVHALAYPLGGLFKISHGESNAVLLPYVFDYIWPACLDKMQLLAKSFGIPTSGLSKREMAILTVTAFKEMVLDVGLPTSLQDYGIQRDDLQRLADEAIKQTRLLARSPMPFTVQDIVRVYNNAWEAKLTHEGERFY